MGIVDQLITLLSTFVFSAFSLIALLFPVQAPEPVLTTTQSEAVETAAFPEVPAEEEAEEEPESAIPQPKPIAETVTTAPKSLPHTPTKSETQINEETRAALVNIFCTSQQGINGISGSGVLVDSRGIILTNAHVAQYFLLRDYLFSNNIQCTVRTGSPATPSYTAELLYLPPAWITANAAQLGASVAVGTGEHDYAFLRLTGRTNGEPLPTTFPHLKMDRGAVDVGRSMLLASYPAGFLGGETLLKNLYASSAVAYVTQLFTFSDNRSKVDLFSIGGTVVSQGGSSGGAAVRLSDGSLAGVITLATAADSTGKRDLRALSLSHIDESLAAGGQGGVTALLSGDAGAKASTFNTSVAPGLRQQLLEQLSQ